MILLSYCCYTFVRHITSCQLLYTSLLFYQGASYVRCVIRISGFNRLDDFNNIIIYIIASESLVTLASILLFIQEARVSCDN